MIIIRAPLRISLFGGGTDMDPFMTTHGGKVLSFAIDKYVYLSAHPLVESSDILLKYSINERVSDPIDIKHRVFRYIAQEYKLKGIDIAVSSDIAAGTGLGSSSAFTVGLINLLEAYESRSPSKRFLANKACEIEIDHLSEPIGLQDQFASAFGGINVFQFNSRNDVLVQPIFAEESMIKMVEESFLLVRIRGTRSASELLELQRTSMNESIMVKRLEKMKSLVDEGLKAFGESPKVLGELLDESWELKKKLSSDVTNSYVDATYNALVEYGCFGGKLLGAGGSGYLLMVGPSGVIKRLHESEKFSTLAVRLDTDGSRMIYSS
jgi:D-glycero-alpha-D-manno-heptose-7-phosphate kinase